MKKILALVVAALMLIGMMSVAFADDPAPAAAATPTLGLDGTVSITNLMAGDVVKLYQVLTWSDTANDFVLAAGFEGLRFADGQTAADAVAALKDSITQAEANAVAAYTKTATAKDVTDPALTGTTYSYTLPTGTDGKTTHDALGMYVGVITAGTPKFVYNPVFVSADFVTSNASNTISASDTYSNTAVAKRTEITVDKYTSDSNETDWQAAINSYVGETVKFKVETTIPVFMDSYKNPSFVINDAIKTAGINLVANSVKVKLGDTQYNAGQYSVTDTFTVAENDNKGYTVTFDAKYLSANTVSVPVVIEYQGTITGAAEFNIREDYNDVTVTYSNGPDEEVGALRDETNHYTFSIGAKVFGDGENNGKTYELVKVGVDAEGKPIVEEKEIASWNETIKRHPLANATFGLYTDIGCAESTRYKLGKYSDTSNYPNGAEFTTGNDGIISFEGLAAGTYYIKELSAPAGYIKDDRVTAVTITAVYKNVDVPAQEDTIGGKTVTVAGYSVDVLDYYTVSVNGVSILEDGKYGETNKVDTKYEYDNEGPRTTTLNKPTSVIKDAEKINTQGTELPSTGGMGTTLLYVGGSILVLAAVILLVTKRRMGAND